MFFMNGKSDVFFCACCGIFRNSAAVVLSAFLLFASCYSSSAEDVVNDDETPPAIDCDKLLQDASDALKKNNTDLALKLARAIMDGSEAYTESWHQGADILGRANTIIYTDPQIPDSKKFNYVVRQGDTLDILAKDFGVTVGAILKNNNMSPESYIISVGKKLSIYAAKWEIKIKKKCFRMYLCNNGELFKVYPVTVGRNGKTPSGTFELASKVLEPDWTHEGRVIPFGAKEHPLGTRWMNLRPVGETNPKLNGYGVHGTWHPERIGRAESNGCIRMKNADIEELFEIVPYKTPLTIED